MTAELKEERTAGAGADGGYTRAKGASRSPSQASTPYPLENLDMQQLEHQKRLLEEMMERKNQQAMTPTASVDLLGIGGKEQELTLPKKQEDAEMVPARTSRPRENDTEADKSRKRSQSRKSGENGGAIGVVEPGGRDEVDSPTVSPRSARQLKNEIHELRELLRRQGTLLQSTAWNLSATQKAMIPSLAGIKLKHVSIETFRAEMKVAWTKLREADIALAQNPYERPYRIWLTDGARYGDAVKLLKKYCPNILVILMSPSNVEQQEYQCRTLRSKLAEGADMKKEHLVCQFPKKKNSLFDSNDDWCIKVGTQVVCSMAYDHQSMTQTLRTTRVAMRAINDMEIHEFEQAWYQVNEFMMCKIELMSDNYSLPDVGLARGKGKGKGKTSNSIGK